MLRLTRFRLSAGASERHNSAWCLGVVFTLFCAPLIAQDAPASGSPLDRLKHRSATARWQQAKQDLFDEPTVTDVERPESAEPLQRTVAAPSQGLERPFPEQSSWTPVAPKAPERPHGLFEPGSSPVPPPGRLFEKPLTHSWADESTSLEPEHDSIAEPARKDLLDLSQSGQRQNAGSADASISRNSSPLNTVEAVESGFDFPESPAGESSSEIGFDPASMPTFQLTTDAPSEKADVFQETGQPKPMRTAQVPEVPPQPEPDAGELQDIVFRPITEIEPFFDYSPTGTIKYEYLCPRPKGAPEELMAQCPSLRRLPSIGSTERYFQPMQFQWQASNLFHNPLYFQDVSLERYGHTYPPYIQPFVSVAKASAQFAGLPYQMAIDSMWAHQYTVGYYRPGQPAPCLTYQIPFNLHAAAAAGGVWTGLIFIFP